MLPTDDGERQTKRVEARKCYSKRMWETYSLGVLQAAANLPRLLPRLLPKSTWTIDRLVENFTSSAKESRKKWTMDPKIGRRLVNGVENVGRAYRPYRKSEKGSSIVSHVFE